MTAELIRDDAWLSSIIGRSAFRIDTEATQAADLIAAVGQHAHEQTAAFYYARVATENVELARFLARAGLYVVDVNVTLEREATSASIPTSAAVAISDALPAQHPAVLEIAGSCFRYSRFHLDPSIPRSVAHRVKREWIANCLQGLRGQGFLVASIDERPAGFLAILASRVGGEEVRTIDLVGVANELQGRGIGKALVRAFIDRYEGRCDRLAVGTQAANVPSLRLYQAFGFRIARTAYVMHAHMGPPIAG